MSIQDDNKAIVGRWFTNFWGKTCDLAVVGNKRNTAAGDRRLESKGDVPVLCHLGLRCCRYRRKLGPIRFMRLPA